jgi:hypothetical protein
VCCCHKDFRAADTIEGPGVIEGGSAFSKALAKAAKRRNISTSGLSPAIRRLEQQIGVRRLSGFAGVRNGLLVNQNHPST